MPVDSVSEDALKQELLQTDDEFRRLYEEHQECEQRLADIDVRTLSWEDENEVKRLKLHKLALKDRMYEILREHTATAAVA